MKNDSSIYIINKIIKNILFYKTFNNFIRFYNTNIYKNKKLWQIPSNESTQFDHCF